MSKYIYKKKDSEVLIEIPSLKYITDDELAIQGLYHNHGTVRIIKIVNNKHIIIWENGSKILQ